METSLVKNWKRNNKYEVLVSSHFLRGFEPLANTPVLFL